MTWKECEEGGKEKEGSGKKGKKGKGRKKRGKRIAERSRTILDQAMGLTNYRCSTAKRWALNHHALFVHIHC
jgi:hypothetical protein